MKLQQLPPEILLRILDYVGAPFFRKDIRRLCVSKEWFTFAHIALLKELRLTQARFRHLFLDCPSVEKAIASIKETTETVDVYLSGFKDWSKQSRDVPAESLFSWDETPETELVINWTTDVDKNLTRLAGIARECRKLRTLRIGTQMVRWHAQPYLPRRDYLSLATVRELISLQRLTVLELDLFGTHLMTRDQEDHHICPVIAGLLSQLRRLELRMRSICPEVLVPQKEEKVLRLREVVINLSLLEEFAATSLKLPTRCGGSRDFLALKAEIEDQARALAAQMASPKVVRVLYSPYPLPLMRTFDIVNNKHMELDSFANWDADGKILEEDSDSDSSVSLTSNTSHTAQFFN